MVVFECQLRALHVLTHRIQLYEIATLVISVLQMRKLE